MTDAELKAKNRALSPESLAIGYRNTKHWLRQCEQLLEEEKREFASRPDLYQAFASGTINQIADLRRELAAYEREFHRRGLPLAARESSPQAA